MNESDVNRIFSRSLDWGYKIPDPPKAVATNSGQRPFDGFGRLDDKILFWEGKYLKGLKSFNLKAIQDHQIANLKALEMKNTFTYIVLGIYAGRGDFRFYLFDFNYVYKRFLEERNFKKKELDKLPYVIPHGKGKDRIIDILPNNIIKKDIK